ncbi:DUF6318 family protein [Arthrobacter sp. NPDC090010]|uniref:DUF6318 family protein n=1 Tax=Arthrobacter sp. NPDC090010 TaxID=3363942 RepID=UPI00382F2E3D
MAACDAGTTTPSPSPAVTATASTSATPSPRPTPSAGYKPATATSKAQNVPIPVLPEAAKKKTPEGAKAFVGYWTTALSYAYETGDTRYAAPLGTSGCQLCQSLLHALEEKWDDGGWIEGGKITAGPSEIRARLANERVGLVAQFNQASFKTHRANGSISESQGIDTLALGISLEFAGGSWRIRDAKLWTAR